MLCLNGILMCGLGRGVTEHGETYILLVVRRPVLLALCTLYANKIVWIINTLLALCPLCANKIVWIINTLLALCPLCANKIV